jgi:ComF family protein
MNGLDWLYPPICEKCGIGLSGGKALCNPCSDLLPRIAPPFCDVCSEHFTGLIDGSFDCPNCKGVSFHFEFARAAMDRSDDILDLVHRLKYGREIHLGAELGRLACLAFADRRLAVALEEKWPLVPVPLHRSRLMERQFNQAEEIARSIAIETGLPISRLLKRTRRTETQTRLSRKQRMENLRGAFAMREPFPENAPPRYLLVDDVFTTGSTVDECARILKKAGAGRIAVLTVMRG